MFSVSRPMRGMIAPATSRLRALVRDESGVTAVEFGLLAIPFFAIILAILQTAIMFLATQVLDSAVEDASRKVRTGEGKAYTLSDFRTYMCGFTFNLIDCNQIKIKSEVIAGFDTISYAVPQTCNATTCTWTTSWEGYDPGVRRSVVQVSAYYRYPLMVTLPYFNLKNQPDNYRLISAIRVFRNEPY